MGLWLRPLIPLSVNFHPLSILKRVEERVENAPFMGFALRRGPAFYKEASVCKVGIKESKETKGGKPHNC
jgi:hypothetical protein